MTSSHVLQSPHSLSTPATRSRTAGQSNASKQSDGCDLDVERSEEQAKKPKTSSPRCSFCETATCIKTEKLRVSGGNPEDGGFKSGLQRSRISRRMARD